MTKTQYKTLVTDSRSYAGFETNTDHHFVKASFRLEWYTMKPKKDIQERLKITQLPNHAVKKAYQVSVLKKMKTAEEHRRYKHTTEGMAQHSISLSNIW